MRIGYEKHKIGVKASELGYFTTVKRNVDNNVRIAPKNRNFASFLSSLIDQTRRRKAGVGIKNYQAPCPVCVMRLMIKP